MRAVVSDIKLPQPGGTFHPDLLAYFNYYPFGQLQPNRYNPGNPTLANGYRYGFNGKEKDNNGELGLTTYDYGFRIYSSALGRFLSVDPLTRGYPSWSPYPFAMNRPIDGVDLDGKEWSESRTISQETNFTRTTTEFTVKVRVVNNSKIVTSQAEVVEIANNIKQQMETSFQHSSFDEDSQEMATYKTNVVLDFTPLGPGEVMSPKTGFFLNLTDVISKHANLAITGEAFYGESQQNVLMVAVTLDGTKRTAEQYSRDGAHEAGHSAGLPHPWMTQEVEKYGQFGVNQTPSSPAQPKASKAAIKENLMNSGGNPEPKLRDSKGTKVDKSQLESMYKQINDN